MPQMRHTTPPAKAERRASARASRRALEAAEARRARLRSAWRRLGLAAVAALVTVAALVAVGEATLPERAAPQDASATTARYAGIPQDGYTLGSPDAPVTLVEFADMQCPFCAEYGTGVLPEILDRYVRTGQVRLELRTMAFLGPDSVRAAQAVAGAAAQDRMWQFVDRFYERQGAENSGYVTEDFLREVAEGVRGLDVDRVLASRDTAGVARADREARAAGIASTPSFLVGPTGGDLRPAQLESLDAAALGAVLDRELAR